MGETLGKTLSSMAICGAVITIALAIVEKDHIGSCLVILIGVLGIVIIWNSHLIEKIIDKM